VASLLVIGRTADPSGAGMPTGFWKGVGGEHDLKGEDRDRIAAELTGGKVALGVLVGDLQASEVASKLAELGGAAENHAVPADVEADIEAAASAT
jgi:hypothetical protein